MPGPLTLEYLPDILIDYDMCNGKSFQMFIGSVMELSIRPFSPRDQQFLLSSEFSDLQAQMVW